jgi:chorismate mutase
MSEDTLRTLREAIDRADDALLRALGARLQVVKVIAEIKRHEGIPAIDPDREALLVASWRDRAGDLAVPPDLAEALLALVLRHTRGVVSGEVDG